MPFGLTPRPQMLLHHSKYCAPNAQSHKISQMRSKFQISNTHTFQQLFANCNRNKAEEEAEEDKSPKTKRQPK